MSQIARALFDPSSVVNTLAEEMHERWQSGECPVTEVFLDRQHELWNRTEIALELIAEELALREEFGKPTTLPQLVSRFPHWAVQVRALFECQLAFGGKPEPVKFPQVGEIVGEFQLQEELGKGSHGRVFLALQTSLGHRPVVLKVTPDRGFEHLSLARLQQTHIVPLYSAHEFPEYGLRGLCLPYFGGSTLTPPDTVNRLCWIGVCLAEALQYAHDRGLLHLDLKPSNILIAADGTPMLLDFHLARPPLSAGAPAPPWLGGTPRYMAPELAAALQAVRAGEAIPTAIDARADLYSMGVVLRETGLQLPLTTGLQDVLARCTARLPEHRYPSARELAADLRRHLADQPFKGVPNRSLVERWTKWRRRRPFTLPVAVALLALVGVLAFLGVHLADRRDRAETALRTGEVHSKQQRYAEAIEAFRGGEALMAGLPFPGSLGQRLRESRTLAERGQAANELHRFAEQVRPLYAAVAVLPEQLRVAEQGCSAIWAERALTVARLEGQPTPELERQWRADLLDIGIILARLRVQLATAAESSRAKQAALQVLNEAESLVGPSAVLSLERSALQPTVAGKSDLALLQHSTGTTPRNAWEQVILGRAYLGAGQNAEALKHLNLALEAEAGSLWANYYRGVCLYQQGSASEAVEAFSICVALAPKSGWCFYNRGLALLADDRPDRALADFQRALQLDPTLPPPP